MDIDGGEGVYDEIFASTPIPTPTSTPTPATQQSRDSTESTSTSTSDAVCSTGKALLHNTNHVVLYLYGHILLVREHMHGHSFSMIITHL